MKLSLDNRGSRGGVDGYQGRYLAMIAICALAFTVLLGRLWYLQVVRGEAYWRASTENIIRNIETRPPRGRIFDRHRNLLADNRPSYDVVLIPHIFKRSADGETLTRLQGYLNLSPREMERLQKASRTTAAEVLVRLDVSRAQVAMIESDRLRLPGIEVRATPHRRYPMHAIGGHAVGFVGEVRGTELDELEPLGYRSGDYIGRMGVEAAFEAVLRGGPGVERQVVDSRGLPQSEAETRFLIGEYQRVDPVPGRDVVLTLDAELMVLIDEAMRDYPAGAAVALDPRDGSVLALYSKPGFDPNSWSGRLSSQEKLRSDNNPFKPMLDKSVSAYFPGSTFKIAGTLAAMEEGVMTPDDEVMCPGYYRYGGRRFRCWKHGGHGKVNAAEALQQSCDVYFYKVADQLGIDAIADYGFMLGFGEASGFPLNHESAGRMPTKEWHRKHSPDGFHPGFALNTVLGQGDTLATPLQVALSYAAIANEGTLWYPRVVDQVLNPDGSVLFDFPARKRKSLDVSPTAMEVVQKGLWMASNEEGGTSYAHRPDNVVVAGKTGTAQVHRIGKYRVANRDKEIEFRDHAWFAAYAPFDEPSIVLVVFLEHGGSGGSNAAPVAMEILGRYFDEEGASPLERRMGDLREEQP